MLSWAVTADHTRDGRPLPCPAQGEGLEFCRQNTLRPIQSGRVPGILCPMPGDWETCTHSSSPHRLGKDPGSLSPEQCPLQGLRPGGVRCPVLGAQGLLPR